MTSNSPSSPHTSTLTISPLVTNRRKDVFYTTTPPNQAPVQQDQQLQGQQQRTKIFGASTPASSSKLNRVRYNSSTDDIDGKLAGEDDDDDDVDGELGDDVDAHFASQQPLTQADKLRLWRHDSLMQHHYKTAEYIGDKVLALTKDPNDAFWLAQVHYNSGNYQRARELLSGKEFEESVSCRYLACLCMMKLEKWEEALDIIGESNPFKNENSVKNQDGGIKLEASMCYLRGVIYSNFNNFDKAKECFKEACLIDVKCYEAFDELASKNLMTPREEYEFLSSLNFEDADNNDELVKLLYTTKLNKYLNVQNFKDAELRLEEEYNLQDNNDLLLSKADLLFVQCKFQQCLEICETVLRKDQFNFNILPNYLSCLHELGGKNKLFLIAHKLAEFHPNNHITWLAVGIYYLSIKKIAEARRFFSKASLLNPNFGHAWIGFAHTFAAEGEHEQAISAYATAARLLPGTHLPNLYLGMQYLQMNNLSLAHEYLNFSFAICPSDPLLLNEIGVMHYHRGDLSKSQHFFNKALLSAKNLNSDTKSWLSIHSNLGHVYRRQKDYDKSLQCFNQVLKISSKDSNVYSAIGLIYIKQNRLDKAIESLHVALSLQPNDPVASDLLRKALEDNAVSYGIDQLSAMPAQVSATPANDLDLRSSRPPVSDSFASLAPRTQKPANATGIDDIAAQVESMVQEALAGSDSDEEDGMELASD